MNKFVREHYPASKLPEDLRAGVDPAATVTITIVEEEEADAPQHLVTLEEIFASRRPPFRSTQEIDAELRRQRDAWGD
jgi:hypothetical protein